ncbi:unnamed protein product [Cochlearia groenlandica]
MRCGCCLVSSEADRTGLKKRELKRFPVTSYGSREDVIIAAATECPASTRGLLLTPHVLIVGIPSSTSTWLPFCISNLRPTM